MKPDPGRVRGRIERLCRQPIAERPLREAVLEQLRSVLGFPYYAWLLTDPETWVGTAPLAEVPAPAELPELIRAKYQARLHRWTSLPPGRWVSWATAPASALEAEWPRRLRGYRVTDVASVSLRDRYGSWAFLDLWRCGGARPVFSPAELAWLSVLTGSLTSAVRRAQAATFRLSPASTAITEASVLVLTDDLHPASRTPAAETQLRRLLPTAPEQPPIPAAAYNVAAQLLAVEQGVDDRPARVRAHLAGSTWISVRASRLAGTDGSGAAGIAVTLEPMTRHERVELYARACGLSVRERQLLHELVRGADTAALAETMAISELTVQDHLKSIFAKAGVGTRYALITRASGG